MEEIDKMTDELIALLETLGYSACLQGSYTDPKEYPESFFTVWNFDSDIDKFYNNKEYRCIHSFWINFYTCKPEIVKETLEKTRKLLKDNGWRVPSKGVDVASGHVDYIGKELEVYYDEKNKI